MINVLSLRKDGTDSEIDLQDMYATYIKANNSKLELAYDRGFYYTLIAENKDGNKATTPSQQRLSNAKRFFIDELSQLSTSEIEKIFHVLEEANINRIEFRGKEEASLMFELQNNRGKDLTNLEKLKSFFMYQMYVHSANDEETTYNVNYVAEKFKNIYLTIQDYKFSEVIDDDDETVVKLSEDTILLYHAYAFSNKNFGYRKLQEILDELKSNDNKPEWIKSFVNELLTTFDNIKSLVACNDKKWKDLLELKIPAFVYPFLIKGMSIFKDDKHKMSELFGILEKTVFRFHLINTRASINSRLNDAIRNLDNDLEKLKKNIYSSMEKAGYWSDERFEERLKGNMYANKVTKYLLWKYEDSLQKKGYSVTVKINNVAEEHISPKTESNEGICSGYEVDENGKYTKEFIENNLNCIGNLLLISQSHNSSIGNVKFNEKLKSYKEVMIMKQQVEIEDYCKNEEGVVLEQWHSTNIQNRKNDIVNFALNKWSLKKETSDE